MEREIEKLQKSPLSYGFSIVLYHTDLEICVSFVAE